MTAGAPAMPRREPRTIPHSGGDLPGLLVAPDAPRALLVLAHGAGAGMEHRFMEEIAKALATRGIAALRFQFPYTAAGKKRPDPEPVLRGAVAAAVAEGAVLAGELAPDSAPLPLFAGGKSMGGRMTSRAAAAGDLDGIRLSGIVFLGFPLHPAGRPGTDRADHLAHTRLPLLFLQGDRDALAELDLLRPVLEPLGPRATLHVEEGADHGFHVLKRSGRTDSEVVESLAERAVEWMEGTVPGTHPAAGP
jgi:uncharacterized protein